MDEREAREWLLKRRGGLGKRGTDPADWGSDLADDWALEVLAKAAYKRRKIWVVGILLAGYTIDTHESEFSEATGQSADR
jgi:hypothetical protein